MLQNCPLPVNVHIVFHAVDGQPTVFKLNHPSIVDPLYIQRICCIYTADTYTYIQQIYRYIYSRSTICACCGIESLGLLRPDAHVQR